MWHEKRRITVRIEIDFVAAVRVEIHRHHVRVLLPAMRKSIGDSFCLHQRAPRRRPQVGRIKSTKNAVPVGIVTLAAQDESLRLAASRKKCLVVAAALIETTDYRRNVLHFLMQEI